MPKNLNTFFSPKSIAIIGASRSSGKVGGIILKNIVDSGYKSEIFPVNPNTKKIGKLKCFKSVLDLPAIPDLAIIVTPAETIPKILDEIGEKGTKNVVIISAGFKETGLEGQKLEKEIQNIALKYEISVLGPNCLGFVNKNCPVNATFGDVSKDIGNISFVTQSGAIATSVFDWCNFIGLGFNDCITLGNKAVLNENDILEYIYDRSNNLITSLSLSDDSSPKINPIGLYLESISEGKEFISICRKITKKDPIFILKPGKTKASVSAMQSHTGAIAGADDVLEEALNQAGVLRCESLEDFFDLSKAFSWGIIPRGPKVAVISNAGGPAVLSADCIAKEGLEIAKLSEETKNSLLEILPKSSSVENPVDVLGDALADRFLKTVEVILKSDECDSILVILTPQTMTEVEKTAEVMGIISKEYSKPIFCSFIGGKKVFEGEEILNKYQVPFCHFPERAIYSLGCMWKFKKMQNANSSDLLDIYQVLNTDLVPEDTKKIIDSAIENGFKNLGSTESNRVVENAGIKTTETINASDVDDAIRFANEKGYPVVLKLSSPGLVHKKKIGGFVMGIKNDDELNRAWNDLGRVVSSLDKNIKETVKFQIQKEINAGVEVIVGVKRDKTFGDVMLFGAGGSYAELISDKNLSLFPIDTERAKKLVLKSKVYNLLKENKSEGKPEFDLDKLYDLMFKLGKLVEASLEIEEIEINPVIVNKEGIWAVDTKVVLKDKDNTRTNDDQKFKYAKVLNTDLLVNKTRYFEFESEEPLNAKPGQYITVKVSDTRMNCYSIAGQSTPTKFNLLVDSTPGGPGSKFFENLKVGDKISFLGPYGSFILKPEENVNSLLFLSTGCGFAPLKYMIETALKDKNFNQDIKLYFGFNNYEDIFFRDYFEKLAKENNRFNLQIAVNNPNPKWNGPTGFITDLVKKDYPDTSKCSAYLCGNKIMVEDVSKLLTERGCPKDRVYSEKYGF